MRMVAGSAALSALLVTAAHGALPDFDAYRSSLVSSADLPALPAGVLPHQVDRRMGLPTFLWAAADAPVAAVGALNERALLEARAREHLRHNASALRLSEAMIAEARITEAQYNGKGPATVRFNQRFGGIEVFQRSLNVLLDRAGKPVAVSGYFAPVSTTTGGFAMDPAAAILIAATQLGLSLDAAQLVAQRQSGESTWFAPAASSSEFALTRGPRLKPVYYALASGLEPAYYIELFAASDRETLAYSFVVSAVDGRLLFRKNLTARAAFSYRVFAAEDGLLQPHDSPLGNGYEPFPSADPNAPVTREGIPSSLISLESAPMISTGDPWLPEGATETRGNNVDAYTDTALPDGYFAGVPGTAPVGNGPDLRPTVTAPGVFDYPLVADMDPTTDEAKAAAAVTLFYVNNWLHDLYYDHGFNEESGVAQASNYGRGGEEGDAVLAEGQDWSGRNNANMATPSDGSAPTMQMFLFDGPDSLPGAILVGPSSPGDYDGTLDPLIIAHENSHYVSNRLIGNGNGLNNNQGGSMGEGWGDVASLLIAVREEDRALPFNRKYEGTYSVGVYVDPNFYYSIRRQPYSTDFTRNSFTFRHIADGEAAPTGAPTQGSGTGSAEVHDAGEIWANMMWECWAGLLNDPRHDFATARDRFVNYMIVGMKLTPSSPTFTEARDGVLAAALATDAADFQSCGRGFARRGAGMNAVSPDRSSTDHAGVVESYEEFTLSGKALAPAALSPERAAFGGSFGSALLLPLCAGIVRRRRQQAV